MPATAIVYCVTDSLKKTLLTACIRAFQGWSNLTNLTKPVRINTQDLDDIGGMSANAAGVLPLSCTSQTDLANILLTSDITTFNILVTRNVDHVIPMFFTSNIFVIDELMPEVYASGVEIIRMRWKRLCSVADNFTSARSDVLMLKAETLFFDTNIFWSELTRAVGGGDHDYHVNDTTTNISAYSQAIRETVLARTNGAIFEVGKRHITAIGMSGSSALAEGWSRPESSFTWSNGKCAKLLIYTDVRGGFRYECILRGHVVASPLLIVISANDEIVSCNYSSGAPPHEVEIRFLLPISIIPRNDRKFEISLWFDKPISPKRLGLGDDNRELGFAVNSFEIDALSDYGGNISVVNNVSSMPAGETIEDVSISVDVEVDHLSTFLVNWQTRVAYFFVDQTFKNSDLVILFSRCRLLNFVLVDTSEDSIVAIERPDERCGDINLYMIPKELILTQELKPSTFILLNEMRIDELIFTWEQVSTHFTGTRFDFVVRSVDDRVASKLIHPERTYNSFMTWQDEYLFVEAL